MRFDYFDVSKRAEPFEAVRLGADGGRDSGGQGGGAGWRDSSFPSMPATTFLCSPTLASKDDNIKRMRSPFRRL